MYQFRPKRPIITLSLVLGIALGCGLFSSLAAQSNPTSDLPPATIINDQGGAIVVTGEASSKNFAFMPELYPNPSVLLIDVTNFLGGEPEKFVAESGQILGVFAKPLFPLPGEFRINLPIEPTGATLDVDNDGESDSGVQIFALRVASNLVNDSYLQQIEQEGGLTSFMTDVVTDKLTQGTFLIYASNGEQGFPSGFGADGLWFTDTILRWGFLSATLWPRSTLKAMLPLTAQARRP